MSFIFQNGHALPLDTSGEFEIQFSARKQAYATMSIIQGNIEDAVAKFRSLSVSPGQKKRLLTDSKILFQFTALAEA